jgi:hypothetical protein
MPVIAPQEQRRDAFGGLELSDQDWLTKAM